MWHTGSITLLLVSCLFPFHSVTPRIDTIFEKAENYYFKEKNYAKSIKLYKLVLINTKDKGLYAYKIARCYALLNLPKQANRYIKKSIRYDPKYYDSYTNDSLLIANSYSKAENTKNILDYYNAIKKHKNWHLSLKLTSLIDSIRISDQLYRNEITRLKNTNKTNFKHDFDSLMTFQAIVDNENGKILTSLIKEIGWPDYRFLDQQHIKYIYILARHIGGHSNKKEELLQYYKAMKKSFLKGNLPYVYIAMIKDQMLVQAGKKQIFGTQVKLEDGKSVVLPVRNPTKLKARRIIAGFYP